VSTPDSVKVPPPLHSSGGGGFGPTARPVVNSETLARAVAKSWLDAVQDANKVKGIETENVPEPETVYESV